jgi:hypothetical protein
MSAEWIEAMTDAQALQDAIAFADCLRVEVWQRNRLVGKIEPSISE